MQRFLILLLISGCLGSLALVRTVYATEGAPLAAELVRAEDLLKQRKFDDALAVLRQVVARKDEDRASAAMGQYRLGLYLGWIKEAAKDRQYWLAQVEAELRKVAADFPEQTEAVNLSRIKLVDALLGQGKIDEAQGVAQQLLDTTRDSPEFQGWAALKLAEVSLAIRPGTAGDDIHAAYLAAIPRLQQVIATTAQAYSEVANAARVKLLYVMVFAWQFDEVPQVCQAVLADHAAGRASDKQAGQALLFEANALTRQERFEEAIAPLEMAAALGDPNHLDIRYKALDDLRGVYVALVDQEYKLGESALFGADDVSTAQMHFEEAHAHSLRADGHKQEQIRMHLARIAARNEDYDRSIAWWRMVIQNPAQLSGGGIEAAEVIAWLYDEKKNQPDQEEAWRLYLLDPQTNADPTAAIVTRELGTTPPGATEQVPAWTVPDRLIALGKLYHREGRFDESKAVFEQVLQAAQTPPHRADALTGLVKALTGKAAELRDQRNWKEAQPLVLEAKPMAEESADLWLAVALEGSCGTSHYATEQAVEGFKVLNLNEKALAMADRFVNELAGADAPLSKIAFARLMQMRALAWNGHLADAAQAGMKLEEQVSSSSGPAFEVMRVQALIRASGYYAHLRNLQQAELLLDKVETLYPGKYDRWLAPYRRMMKHLPRGG